MTPSPQSLIASRTRFSRNNAVGYATSSSRLIWRAETPFLEAQTRQKAWTHFVSGRRLSSMTVPVRTVNWLLQDRHRQRKSRCRSPVRAFRIW